MSVGDKIAVMRLEISCAAANPAGPAPMDQGFWRAFI
jgi:hypothetical protein